MNWQSELYGSGLWFVKAFVCSCVVLWATGFVLIKKTRIGQKFWAIAYPCLQQASTAKVVLMVGVLVAFVLLEVRISVLNTFFYKGLYDSLQEMNWNAFWFFALINFSIISLKVIQEIIDVFLGQKFEIHWLEKLNTLLLNKWLGNQNYYRLQNAQLPSELDNIDQRIEQDATAFISDTVELVRGMMNSVLSSIEFSLILWQLSGVLVLLGVALPKGVVFLLYIFIIVATVLSMWIGKPLIKLNFNKEKKHGDYRYALVQVRNNAESIAFYQGENHEKQTLSAKFLAIIQNRWAIVKRSLMLSGFNSGVTQLSKLLPIMLQAPRFFAGEIKLGDVHQTVQSFNRLMTALSFFRLFYEKFTLYQARINRLNGFLTAIDVLDNPYQDDKKQDDKKLTKNQSLNNEFVLALNEVAPTKQDGTPLFLPVTLAVKAGERLLIVGESGVGKSSLLRAIAGLYPLPILGEIDIWQGKKCHFTPQKSYVPQGTLRQIICYPNLQADDEQIRAHLGACGLKQLAQRLDEVADWQAILSMGQVQRIGFIRILLSCPDVIFLDEATSALDEANEQKMYELIATHLPKAVVVSVGHRTSLEKFHHKKVAVVRAN